MFSVDPQLSTKSSTRLSPRPSPQVPPGHNALSSINWVGGLTDPGEMLGCGKYQQLHHTLLLIRR